MCLERDLINAFSVIILKVNCVLNVQYFFFLSNCIQEQTGYRPLVAFSLAVLP